MSTESRFKVGDFVTCTDTLYIRNGIGIVVECSKGMNYKVKWIHMDKESLYLSFNSIEQTGYYCDSLRVINWSK